MGVLRSPDSPCQIGPKTCFGKLLFVSKFCKQFVARASTMTGTVCFKQRKLIFVIQNLVICEQLEQVIKKCHQKCHIWNCNSDLPIHYMGWPAMMMRVVYS